MQHSEIVTPTPVWTTPWGDLVEQDVPPELWARAHRLPRRKNGGLDFRFSETKAVFHAMMDIAFARYNDAAQ